MDTRHLLSDIESSKRVCERLVRIHNRLLLNFLFTDLDICMTFVELASNPNSGPTTSARNCANARRGYNVMMYYVAKIEAEDQDRARVEKKLGVLKKRLEDLGERL